MTISESQQICWCVIITFINSWVISYISIDNIMPLLRARLCASNRSKRKVKKPTPIIK